VSPQAQATASGLVGLVRDFLLAHERLRDLFARARGGKLDFEVVRDLVGDDDSSLLFRLKERCHTLFRNHDDRAAIGMRREALFDLAVGSLFHEAMKLRENIYQQEVYAPKIRELRATAGEDADELFREFEKILAAVAVRLDEALAETQALLVHTADQLRVLLAGYGEGGLVTRFLVAERDRVESVFPEGLEGLLTHMHGGAENGYTAAARSHLESANFAEAIALYDGALERGHEDAAQHRLRCYARGMRDFQDGEYRSSLEHLQAWLDAEPGEDERAFAVLADSAIARIGPLLEGPESARILALAARLTERLAPLTLAASAGS
jgi:tetratricopeptide (TPR) repeat protein